MFRCLGHILCHILNQDFIIFLLGCLIDISPIFFTTANYKSELLKCIDADQLPVYWGGSLTDKDGDPKCSSKVSFLIDTVECFTL